MYAKIENNEIVQTVNSLKSVFPNVSFPRPMPTEFRGWVQVRDSDRGYFDSFSAIEIIEGVPTNVYVRDAAKVEARLAAHRDYRAKHYPYKGITLKLTSAEAMTSLSTLYLTSLANTDIPDEFVMADWQEEEGDIQITAGDLRADGAAILGNYQKAWSVFKALKSSTFETIEELETAFNEAME